MESIRAVIDPSPCSDDARESQDRATRYSASLEVRRWPYGDVRGSVCVEKPS
ncbi:hypothetical protein V6Z12_D13G058800 [Gossypium hirsutum]